MSYSNPKHVTYALGSQAFTSPIALLVKPPPRRNRGVVLDISTAVTVIFTAVTTPGYVRVGTTGTNAKYAELNMGTAAAGSSYNSRDIAGVIRSDIDMSRDAVNEIRIATVAPTGGTPTGTAYVWVSIDWS